MSFSLSDSGALPSSLGEGVRFSACYFQSRFKGCDAILAQLATNRLNTLQYLRNDHKSVTIVGTCSSQMAPAVLFDTFRYPDLIIWPG